MMQFTLAPSSVAEIAGELLAIPLFEDSLAEKKKLLAALPLVDGALGELLLSSATREGFKAKADQTWTFQTHGKISANHIVLLGLGPRASFHLEVLRQAAGRAAKAAAKVRSAAISLGLPTGVPVEDSAKAAVEGLLLGAYRFDRYRTTDPDERDAARLNDVQLLLLHGKAAALSVKRAMELGEHVGNATNWARDLVNEPAGVLTPTRLADEARKIVAGNGLKISISGRKRIQKLRMGLFLGVAQGSAEKPRLIHVSYIPKNGRYASRPSIAFVGKAITFDSGGLSLKTAEGMLDMKTDMAGSAAVLGAMKVIGEICPPFPVHAFIGACENMPSGTAYRPGDILISRLGKTVEITNTDAEGRLVLGDMLTWANEHKPAAIIDLATLTGACMIALGHYIVGAFGDDEPLMKSVLTAARSAGEEMWRLPITELQKDALRSDVADMKNSGERWGAAINAAMFLKEFVGNTPWVHLDIAGPSVSPKERGYLSKGATGIGVRTLVEFIRQRASSVR